MSDEVRFVPTCRAESHASPPWVANTAPSHSSKNDMTSRHTSRRFFVLEMWCGYFICTKIGRYSLCIICIKECVFMVFHGVSWWKLNALPITSPLSSQLRSFCFSSGTYLAPGATLQWKFFWRRGIDDRGTPRLPNALHRRRRPSGQSEARGSMDWFCWDNLNRKPWFLPSNWSGFPVNFPIIQFYERMIYDDYIWLLHMFAILLIV